jgi:hypothetical protein
MQSNGQKFRNPTTARKYWNKLKQRLGEEGSQLVTNCHQLKMVAGDGKQPHRPFAAGKELSRKAHFVENSGSGNQEIAAGEVKSVADVVACLYAKRG